MLTKGTLPISLLAKSHLDRSLMSFEKRFTQSIEFRSHFDAQFKLDGTAMQLLEKTFKQTSEKALQEPFFSIRQTICALAKDYASDNSVTPYSYQCLADSHVFLRACIDQKAVNEKYMTLTVGDVSFKGKKLFDASRQTMKSVVANGISTKDKQLFHVWLTLADMSVVDLTIINQLTIKGLLQESDSNNQLLNVWRSERKGDFEYHPLLVDDDFLSRLQKPVY